MNPNLKFLIGLTAWLVVQPALAALNIFACEPEWGALAKELAGDKASVYVATTALQDPRAIRLGRASMRWGSCNASRRARA